MEDGVEQEQVWISAAEGAPVVVVEHVVAELLVVIAEEMVKRRIAALELAVEPAVEP